MNRTTRETLSSIVRNNELIGLGYDSDSITCTFGDMSAITFLKVKPLDMTIMIDELSRADGPALPRMRPLNGTRHRRNRLRPFNGKL